MSFNHIFIDCLSVNLQLIITLQIINYYLKYPLTSAEKALARRFLYFFGLILLFTTIISKFGIYDFNLIDKPSSSERAFGLLGDQEAWIFTIYAAVFLFKRNYFFFVFFLFGIFINASIGPFIILLIFTLYFFFHIFNYRYAFIYFTVFIAITAVLLIIDWDNLPILGRLNNYEEMITSGPIGHRLAALSSAQEHVGDHFVLGWGNYSIYVQKEYEGLLKESEMGALTFLASSNNQIIDMFLHFGLLGVIVLILFFWRIYKFLKKQSKINVDDGLYTGIFVWFVVFILFNQSAVWFIPGGFVFLIFTLLLSTFDSKNVIKSIPLINGKWSHLSKINV
jgi:hypothetical protein